jgi:hypothetical protein
MLYLSFWVCLFHFTWWFSLTVVKPWNPPRCLSIEEWIKKMWFICTVEFYLPIKNKMLSFSQGIFIYHFILSLTMMMWSYLSEIFSVFTGVRISHTLKCEFKSRAPRITSVILAIWEIETKKLNSKPVCAK